MFGRTTKQPSGLDAVAATLKRRTEILEASAGDLRTVPGVTEKSLLRLAATDLFVEKAQDVLTERANRMFRAGRFAVWVTAVVLATGAAFTAYVITKDVPELSTTQAVVRIFQSIALGGFLFAGVKMLVALARAYLHQGESLLDRRHALRFGRLFVYLSGGTPSLPDLVEAFEWNKQGTTAFQDIKPEMVSETILHRFLDVLATLPPETVKVLSEAMARPKT